MDFLHDVFVWFNDPQNWEGRRGILHQLYEHVRLSGVAIIAAMALALPVAVWLGHKRRFGTVAMNVSNIGRAIPSFAILVIGTQVFGLQRVPIIGSLTTFIALVALAVPPLVTNGYVAVAEVDSDIRDSARGMGMSDRQLLWRVELPLAVPLLMAGVRTAAVQVVATATIAAFVGADGLGRFIIDGNATRDEVEIFAGAFLVAVLSLATEGILAAIQVLLTPKGLRGAEHGTAEPTAPVLPGAAVEVAA
ncbi:ABC transporter permease [soil metagenome]